jgi:selenide,water dikinase
MKKKIRLTQYSTKSGCAAKLSATDLTEVLKEVPLARVKELLVGIEHCDDAAAFKIDKDTVLVQTVDFFTPIVDSPYLFGQIAAANALSDVYAMGSKPITALSLVAFPPKLGHWVLEEILKGGRDKIEESGAVVVGGHSLEDKEPKFGYAVTGISHPEKIVTSAGAKIGDKLILTKPIGLGVLATALKGGIITEEEMMDAIDNARTLNRKASEIMIEVGVNSCTDITGFGFLGHLHIMLKASSKSARIYTQKVPVYQKALELAQIGFVPAGTHENRRFVENYVKGEPTKDSVLMDILLDPQTSGGLLISVSDKKSDLLIQRLNEEGIKTKEIVGEIVKEKRGNIKLI